MIEIENKSTGSTYEYWYEKGTDIHHRQDGPAIVRNDGSNLHAWFFHGVYIKCASQEEFESIVKTEKEYEHYISGHVVPFPNKLQRESFYDCQGKLHKTDGPAIISNEWFFHGIEVCCNSQEEFERTVKTEEEYEVYIKGKLK